MANYPKWLLELVDEYEHSSKNRSDMTLARLWRIFGNFPENVMVAAVDRFILENERGFFPTVGELRPFVDREMVRDQGSITWNESNLDWETMTPAARRAVHLKRMAAIRASIEYSDDDIFKWERNRDPTFAAGIES